MKTFYITNREEFGATIKAKNAEEAKKIFLEGKAKYVLVGELYDEYCTVEDENGNEVEV